MTTYRGELADGATIYVGEHQEQTSINVLRGSGESHQGQMSRVQSGAWTRPPTLYGQPDGAVLQLHGSGGEQHYRLTSGGVQSLGEAPDLEGAAQISLMEVDEASVPQLKPMTPMTPMQPLDD
ncbi:hypothetical protein [Deinococcus sonorensis]|uniref:Uncharacterized protein n=2 Tax=Deinococcus sonorensis TaxID=309891 RepID=A0AAU7UBM0_9DEIO